jgi:hypothetical protein
MHARTIITRTLRVPRSPAPAGDSAAVARQMDAVLAGSARWWSPAAEPSRRRNSRPGRSGSPRSPSAKDAPWRDSAWAKLGRTNRAESVIDSLTEQDRIEALAAVVRSSLPCAPLRSGGRSPQSCKV